ncbi:putative nuclease HARBI1 [Aedes aegypti]|uniref:Uncharacterized protein n=4 Tax=Aedes aegypti TaxID=7159 RepID=A0A6I8U861_AEDAE|nr:putative nuclease HARBI1 [Aedes aegypti]
MSKLRASLRRQKEEKKVCFVFSSQRRFFFGIFPTDNMSLLRNFRFIINLVIAASSVVLLKKRNQRKRKRAAHWVHPYLAERKSKGRYATDFDDMVSGEKFFKENFHMSKNSFDQLFKLVEKDLAPKRNTRPKDGIPPKLKLGLVIEYLASGGLQRHLASCYRVSKQHMGSIIDQVCDAICRALSAYVADPCQESFLDVANGFNSRWNFPNCIGAIDGKHVSIKAPPNAGSIFYNYKGFHSLALMAICDASYRFTYLDVGAYGSEGDCNIFKESKFGTDVLHDRLDFPENATVNGVKLPFFYVADDAFPLCKRIIKPYSKKNLSAEERIFNYRLSRARRCIENAFGLLCSKWACLKKTLYCSPDRAQKIISACCQCWETREYSLKTANSLASMSCTA